MKKYLIIYEKRGARIVTTTETSDIFNYISVKVNHGAKIITVKEI